VRPDLILDIERHVRQELTLQRLLATARRTASAIMPTVSRTAIPSRTTRRLCRPNGVRSVNAFGRVVDATAVTDVLAANPGPMTISRG
jgi:hypothetical protein